MGKFLKHYILLIGKEVCEKRGKVYLQYQANPP